jgi:hypothetical protein
MTALIPHKRGPELSMGSEVGLHNGRGGCLTSVIPDLSHSGMLNRAKVRLLAFRCVP